MGTGGPETGLRFGIHSLIQLGGYYVIFTVNHFLPYNILIRLKGF